MLVTTRQPMLDRLVGDAIASLDIPDNVFERAVARYEAAAAWLEQRWQRSGVSGLIYPQGSFRLGTVVRPIHADGEYDMDLVCRRDLQKESITQALLKGEVGRDLGLYVGSGPEGSPTLDEGKRCWTLDYPGVPFHMDVLPAVPDLEAQPNGILLTDRELVHWQVSNPVDFAEWFYARLAREARELREVFAKQMDVEDVPAWYVKTTLQRTVQALKRHRDIYFVDAPEHRPASIIITTLAARAYTGSGSLYEVLVDVTKKMPTLIEHENGVWVVRNPVQPKENFADRWRSKPGSDERFFRWLHQAGVDFAAIGEERGLDTKLTKIAKSFGEAPKRAAAAKLGIGMREAREAGKLGAAAATGTLGAVATKSRPVRPHVFHGDARP